MHFFEKLNNATVNSLYSLKMLISKIIYLLNVEKDASNFGLLGKLVDLRKESVSFIELKQSC